MDFNDINLRPDSANFFSTGPQNTASGQANFGPFSVGISPDRAPIHLSQAAGATTDSTKEYYALITENIGAISSDEDFSRLRVAHESPANTGKVFEQNGKKPVEFIEEMANLMLEKDRFKPEELSQIKEEDGLPCLLTPYEVKDENGQSYIQFIHSNDFEVKGILDPQTWKDHTLKPDIEPKVKTVYSFMEGEQDSVDIYIGFGILESGHPFMFEDYWNSSSQSFASDPACITIAPDWNILIDNLDDKYLKKFLDNMNKCNSKLLNDWLKITASCSLNDVRYKLKVVLSPVLLNKFCQQVIDRINN
ncbi:hypothetical protein [Endozoicomonas sp. ALE010]|uniref:hypothetical protein n=1 Tax=Endozoicomonas sp. ALE010 TaxID=3403081 RepID=UPI003BB5E0D0